MKMKFLKIVACLASFNSLLTKIEKVETKLKDAAVKIQHAKAEIAQDEIKRKERENQNLNLSPDEKKSYEALKNMVQISSNYDHHSICTNYAQYLENLEKLKEEKKSYVRSTFFPDKQHIKALESKIAAYEKLKEDLKPSQHTKKVYETNEMETINKNVDTISEQYKTINKTDKKTINSTCKNFNIMLTCARVNLRYLKTLSKSDESFTAIVTDYAKNVEILEKYGKKLQTPCKEADYTLYLD